VFNAVLHARSVGHRAVAARCKQALIDRAPSAMNAQVTTLLTNVVY
jgi:hypothetical protein